MMFQPPASTANVRFNKSYLQDRLSASRLQQTRAETASNHQLLQTSAPLGPGWPFLAGLSLVWMMHLKNLECLSLETVALCRSCFCKGQKTKLLQPGQALRLESEAGEAHRESNAQSWRENEENIANKIILGGIRCLKNQSRSKKRKSLYRKGPARELGVNSVTTCVIRKAHPEGTLPLCAMPFRLGGTGCGCWQCYFL